MIPVKVYPVVQTLARPARRLGLAACLCLALALALPLLTGCQSVDPSQFGDISHTKYVPPTPDLKLREGDSVRITFPGSTGLDTVQQIRRDGKISLPMVGEVKAVGLTPKELQQQLLKLYGPQLVTKEVNVALDSSAFFVFVTGAVARPGRISYDRPITALEAIIDAGVDYSKANLKNVTVIRDENGKQERHQLNLKVLLQGQGGEPFYLKPSDIVFVREKFTWF